MKTTIDIADALLRQARQEAQREGTTLKSIMERALRLLLSQKPPKRKKFKPVVVDGHTPPEAFTWEAMRKVLYDDYEVERLRRASSTRRRG